MAAVRPDIARHPGMLWIREGDDREGDGPAVVVGRTRRAPDDSPTISPKTTTPVKAARTP